MIELGVVAIVRDEARYIREWIAFHRLVGVERFWLYDDGSTDDTPEIALAAWPEGVHVEPFEFEPEYAGAAEFPFSASHQINAFNRWSVEHGAECQWAAFIDPDEYLYHASQDDLRTALREEIEPKRWDGLFVNWLVFGSNDHLVQPVGLTIEAYTQRGLLGDPPPTGRHGKVIIRPEAIERWGKWGSHLPDVRQYGRGVRNEQGLRVKAATCRVPSAIGWRLNHYYHRSHTEAMERVRAIDNNAPPGWDKTADRMRRHDLNEITDRDILRFIPQLQEAIR